MVTPRPVKITRIYSEKDGLSYFDVIEQPLLFPVAKQQSISKYLGQSRLFEFDSDFEIDWHVSSKRCYYIYIQGEQMLEVSGGEKRKFGAGDIILAEDTTGKGHRSWSVSDISGRALIIEF